MPYRALAQLALLSVVAGCSTLLGLDEFEDAKVAASGGSSGQAGSASGGTGAGASGGTSPTGGAGGTDGGDGGGTGGTLYGCKVQPKVEILSKIGPQTSSSAIDVLTVSRGGSVFAVVQLNPPNNTDPMIAIKVFGDNASVGPLATFTEAEVGGRFSLSDGDATPSHLYLYGREQTKQKVAILAFPVQGDLAKMPTLTLFDQPCGTDYLKKTVFARTGVPNDPKYAVSCSDTTEANSSLHACQAGVCTPLATKGQVSDPADLNVNYFVHASGVDLLQTESAFHWWRTSGSSWSSGQLDLSPSGPTKNQATIGMGLSPRESKDGALALAAYVDLDTGLAQLFSGDLASAGYPELGKAKPSVMKHQLDAKLSELPLAPACADSARTVIAGATFDHANVKIYEFSANGTLRVGGELVEAPPVGGSAFYHRGSGAPLGPGQTLVMWAEGANASMIDSVWARVLTCDQAK